MTGRVKLPATYVRPGLPDWAVYGDAAHRGNLICSIVMVETELEEHNRKLNAKYARMAAEEQRSELYRTDDADVLVVACNSPSQMAKGAVEMLRKRGIRAGVFRPITLWPFPIDALKPLLGRVRRLVVVEASNGQLEDELRLAASHAGVGALPPIDHVRRFGGVLPQAREIADRVAELGGVLS